MQIEQREYRRVPAVCHYSLEIEGRLHFGQTGNISLGGVYLASCSPCVPNDALGKRGKIHLAVGTKLLELDCVIAYSNGTPARDGVGIRFEKVQNRHYAYLEKYITESA